MKLRDYQERIATDAVRILKQRGIVYLAMEVRTGKTLTALETARLYGAKNVLFLTKKKAMSSIVNDWMTFGYDQHFVLTCMNDESMHKLDPKTYDFVIHDEHHRFGAYPKPGKYTKMFKQMFGTLPMIFLSGTPTPESYSQIYHQFWVSIHHPFKQWQSFYKWANNFVNKKERHLGHGKVTDYSDANKELIDKFIDPYMITFTQKEAGFSTEVNERIMKVSMTSRTYEMIDRLKKDLVIEGKEEVILADTGVKLMQKCHQLYSGTVKFESGNSMVLDNTKAIFIKYTFFKKKIAIFYKFTAELTMLKDVFGDKLTQDIDEFNSDPNKWIALQIVSGREGVNLSSADFLVYLNIDFSAVSYWQSRDRLTTMQRKSNDVFWIFSEGGIEEKIYKAVMKKKDYTLKHFKREEL